MGDVGEFLRGAVSFAVLPWSVALLLVLCFWGLVLAGALDHDAVGGLGLSGFGGAPLALTGSVFVLAGWFCALTGALFTGGGVLPLLAVYGVSVGAAWAAARGAVGLSRRLLPPAVPPSLTDFVGLGCTVRTGRVDRAFGQAEVAAPDGSTALVQVRQYEGALLGLGSPGLLYAYEETGGFFWVTPWPALGTAPFDPGSPAAPDHG